MSELAIVTTAAGRIGSAVCAALLVVGLDAATDSDGVIQAESFERGAASSKVMPALSSMGTAMTCAGCTRDASPPDPLAVQSAEWSQIVDANWQGTYPVRAPLWVPRNVKRAAVKRYSEPVSSEGVLLKASFLASSANVSITTDIPHVDAGHLITDL